MGKVSHEKTRIATRSVKHACSVAMRVFLLFYSFYSWIPTSLWVSGFRSGFLDSDEFVGVWIPVSGDEFLENSL